MLAIVINIEPNIGSTAAAHAAQFSWTSLGCADPLTWHPGPLLSGTHILDRPGKIQALPVLHTWSHAISAPAIPTHSHMSQNLSINLARCCPGRSPALVCSQLHDKCVIITPQEHEFAYEADPDKVTLRAGSMRTRGNSQEQQVAVMPLY